jgi:hypothetical protein
MSWYAATRSRAARQAASDVLVIVWAALWWWVSRLVHGAIDAVADPARSAMASAEELSAWMTDAGATAGNVPLVGEQLAAPFGGAAGTFDDWAAATAEQVRSIERVADLVGWVVLLLPVALLVALWLPVRVRFARASAAARRFIDASADLDLFALRAMANQPMPVLAGISADPVRAWREGDDVVIARLAEVELRRSGILLPERLRPSQPTA